MKALIGFLLMANALFAQYPLDNKRDYIWMFGYGNSPPNWGGTYFDFHTNPPSHAYVNQQINLELTDASTSDMDGNLLFYTNGMYVVNVNHQIMPNGDSLNPGNAFNEWSNGGNFGYRVPQGALILPKPESNIYYIIHEKADIPFSFPVALVTGLYYTIVDMSLDGGIGDVVQKNIPLLLGDTLEFGCMTATRHANGRDWWIIIPGFENNKYYRFLFTPQGIVQDSTQTIGTASTIQELGQAVFAPNGTKYCRYAVHYNGNPYRLDVFDFDRCNGLLGNYQNLWYNNVIDTAGLPGIAISPNSQYLYITTNKRVIQYDLQSPSIPTTEQTVAVYDGYYDPSAPPFKTYFGLEQVGPDNRIYICTSAATRYLHVINNPNVQGVACNVLQHSIQMTFNDWSMPNFPNFRLGPVDGSLCDSLGINLVIGDDITNKPDHSFTVWPNPANDYINYQLQGTYYDKNFTLSIYDQLGRQFKEWEVSGKQINGHFDLMNVQEGVYLVVLKGEKGLVLGSKKVVVIR